VCDVRNAPEACSGTHNLMRSAGCAGRSVWRCHAVGCTGRRRLPVAGLAVFLLYRVKLAGVPGCRQKKDAEILILEYVLLSCTHRRHSRAHTPTPLQPASSRASPAFPLLRDHPRVPTPGASPEIQNLTVNWFAVHQCYAKCSRPCLRSCMT
jgi:hypothetical protein